LLGQVDAGGETASRGTGREYNGGHKTQANREGPYSDAGRDNRCVLREEISCTDALKIAFHGVDVTLTASAPVTVERAVLNARTGRCDSDAPVVKTDEGSVEIHKVPISLRSGDQVNIRWNSECGAVYKAEIKTDEDDYKVNFVL
jgi:hypothetical protein